MSALKDFELLTQIKLYEYNTNDETFINTILPYGHKTNHKLIININNILKNTQASSIDYYIHQLYPYCYTIVWLKSRVFSEILFTPKEKGPITVICCNKCNRKINTSLFKPVHQDALPLYGNYYQFLSASKNKPIYKYSLSHPQEICDFQSGVYGLDYSSNALNIYAEINTTLGSIANQIVSKQKTKAKDLFNQLMQSILEKDNFHDLFIYSLTAITYYLIEKAPFQKDHLYTYLHTTLDKASKVDSHIKLIISSQEIIEHFIHLIYPKKNQTLSYQIQKVLNIMHNQYTKKLSLKRISKELSINVSYLSRQFKKELNMPFTQYLLEYRLYEALKLLQQDYSITDVALMVGFQSSSYFSTCFKKFFHISPEDYRKKPHDMYNFQLLDL